MGIGLLCVGCGRVATNDDAQPDVGDPPHADALDATTDTDASTLDSARDASETPTKDAGEAETSSSCAFDAKLADAPGVVVDDAALAAIPRLRAGAPMHDRRYGHLSFVTAKGSLVVLGGYDRSSTSRDIEEYDPAADAWTIVGAWSDPDPNLLPVAGVALADGRLFVLAADVSPGGSAVSYAAFVFTPGSWVPTRVAPPPRFLDRVVRIEDGRVFAMDNSIDAAVYDPTKDVWQSAPLLLDMENPSLVAIERDRVVVMHGDGSAGSAAVWDGHTNLWSAIPGPPYGAGGNVLHVGVDRVAVMGAYHVEPAGHLVPDFEFIPTPLQTLDLDACAWTIDWSPRTVEWPSGVQLPSGELLFVDGFARFDTAGISPSASAVFEPSARRWTAYSMLPTWVLRSNVDLLPSGAVIITGGTGNCGGCSVFGHAETWIIDPPP